MCGALANDRPNPDPANLSRLLDLLQVQDARLVLNPQRTIDHRVRRAVLAGRNLTLTTKLGDLDVVQRLPGVPPYADLESEAVLVELHDVRFRVCSRGLA